MADYDSWQMILAFAWRRLVLTLMKFGQKPLAGRTACLDILASLWSLLVSRKYSERSNGQSRARQPMEICL